MPLTIKWSEPDGPEFAAREEQLFRGTAETRASIARELATKEGGARDKVVTVVHGTPNATTLCLE